MIGQLLRPDFLKERAKEVVASLEDRALQLDSASQDVWRMAAEEQVVLTI
jgi:hypothetical protein